jgi:hypothetical protein
MDAEKIAAKRCERDDNDEGEDEHGTASAKGSASLNSAQSAF